MGNVYQNVLAIKGTRSQQTKATLHSCANAELEIYNYQFSIYNL
jgi:hypothetical protein